MTQNQVGYEQYRLEIFIAFLSEGRLKAVCVQKCRSRIEDKFDRFGLDMCDILHLLRGPLKVMPHHNPMGGEQFEIHGESVDGDSMVVVGSQHGESLKVTNLWLQQTE